MEIPGILYAISGHGDALQRTRHHRRRRLRRIRSLRCAENPSTRNQVHAEAGRLGEDVLPPPVVNGRHQASRGPSSDHRGSLAGSAPGDGLAATGIHQVR